MRPGPKGVGHFVWKEPSYRTNLHLGSRVRVRQARSRYNDEVGTVVRVRVRLRIREEGSTYWVMARVRFANGQEREFVRGQLVLQSGEGDGS